MFLIRKPTLSTMNTTRANLCIAVCLTLISGCSRDTELRSSRVMPKPAGGLPAVTRNAAPESAGAYPYTLGLGNAVYHVEQEANIKRLVVELSHWSDTSDGRKEAVFRATNAGDRPALVWNVRQQVYVQGTNRDVVLWETRHSDYPGRGWQQVVIPPGGSETFPLPSPAEGDWRVCLLYSREIPGPLASDRRFDGAYESIGPGVREAD